MAKSQKRLEALAVLDEIRQAPPAKLRKILRAFGKECYELGYDAALRDFEEEVKTELKTFVEDRSANPVVKQ